MELEGAVPRSVPPENRTRFDRESSLPSGVDLDKLRALPPALLRTSTRELAEQHLCARPRARHKVTARHPGPPRATEEASLTHTS